MVIVDCFNIHDFVELNFILSGNEAGEVHFASLQKNLHDNGHPLGEVQLEANFDLLDLLFCSDLNKFDLLACEPKLSEIARIVWIGEAIRWWFLIDSSFILAVVLLSSDTCVWWLNVFIPGEISIIARTFTRAFSPLGLVSRIVTRKVWVRPVFSVVRNFIILLLLPVNKWRALTDPFNFSILFIVWPKTRLLAGDLLPATFEDDTTSLFLTSTVFYGLLGSFIFLLFGESFFF